MMSTVKSARLPVYLLGLLIISTVFISSCASTDKPPGVVFMSDDHTLVFGRRDIFNVNAVQEPGGTILVTLWLSDPGIKRLSTMLANTDDKRITLLVGGRVILKDKLIENVGHLHRIQMRAANSAVASSLVEDIRRAKQGK